MELKGMAGGQQQPEGASDAAVNGSTPANDNNSSSNGSEEGRLSRASSQASLANLADHALQMHTAAREDQQEDQQSLLHNEE